MKTILFVMLPTSSHYLTCLDLANELKLKGFNIIFTGNNDSLEILVNQNGFNYVQMDYQFEYSIPNFKVLSSFLILSFLSKSFLFERYRAFYSNVLEIKRLLTLTKANTIFIDEHLYQYYFYFLSEKCKIFLINTKLLTYKQGNNPPLNSSYIPQSTFISKTINELLWIKVFLEHKLKELQYKLAFCGKDDNFFIKRFCKKNNINYELLINRQNAFYYGIKDIKKIILAPEYLEPSLNDKNNVYICLEDKRNEKQYFTDEYVKLKNRIVAQQNSKIILCSFGTLVKENDKTIFLNRLNEATNGANFLLIVVSKNINIIKNQNDNVLIYPSVPQLDLLKYCDLMIHHGGFNTIKECMQFQVPMLIYALKKESYDWLGNAARVKWRGLGIVGNIYKDSPSKIKENIKKALLIKMPKQNYEQEHAKLQDFIKKNLD